MPAVTRGNTQQISCSCCSRCTRAAPNSEGKNLWTPQSERKCVHDGRGCHNSHHAIHRVDFASQNELAIWAGQGPPPPNPMVVERFQQVITQLFQQVCHDGSIHTTPENTTLHSASCVLAAPSTTTWPTSSSPSCSTWTASTPSGTSRCTSTPRVAPSLQVRCLL